MVQTPAQSAIGAEDLRLMAERRLRDEDEGDADKDENKEEAAAAA